MKYKCILADPPWMFRTYSDKGKDRSPDKHYHVMNLDDIINLPIKQIVEDPCGLFLWVPDNHFEQALQVINGWGFKYKSIAFTWYKTKKDVKKAFKDYFGGLDLTKYDFNDFQPDKFFRIGLGYGVRKQTEICLYATTETPPKRKDAGVRQVLGLPIDEISGEEVFQPITKHSEKPKELYNRIERLIDGPYLELFGRDSPPGWKALGDEIDGKDIKDALKELIDG